MPRRPLPLLLVLPALAWLSGCVSDGCPGRAEPGEATVDGFLIEACVVGSGSSQIYDGPYREYYPSGALATEGQFVDDEQQGRWRSWYEDGSPETLSHWRDDVPHGLYRLWAPDGAVLESRCLQDGVDAPDAFCRAQDHSDALF